MRRTWRGAQWLQALARQRPDVLLATCGLARSEAVALRALFRLG